MATPPVSFTRLKQIANDACQKAIGAADCYDHSKTEFWNQTIINHILKSVISEATPEDATAPAYKFSVNSTIVQHLVPTTQLNRSRGAGTATHSNDPAHIATSEVPGGFPDATATAAHGTDGKPHVGRRGMHSAAGAYWNQKTDGMWSFKYDGGADKGMDVVIMLIWIAV